MSWLAAVLARQLVCLGPHHCKCSLPAGDRNGLSWWYKMGISLQDQLSCPQKVIFKNLYISK